MMSNKSFIFRFADVEVREREFCLVKAGEVVSVEPKAFRVLLLLLHNSQKLISKEELVNSVWGDTAVTDGSLTRCIWLLRRLLGDDVNQPHFIETVATVGYRFVCKVERFENASYDLQATDRPIAFLERAPVETPADRAAAEEAPNGLAPGETLPLEIERTERQTERKTRFRGGLVPGAIILVFGLAAAIWYLRRALPPLRVTEYTQITHDGRPKAIAGADESRIYFNFEYGAEGPAQVAISGGEIAHVPVALPLSHIKAISPQGSTLLVTSFEGGQGSLWNVELPAGSLRRLLSNVQVLSAAWSPDAKSVVYSDSDGNLNIIRADGTGNRRLANWPGTTESLSWSPDGSRIRFTRANRLWEVSSDGSGLHPLLPSWRPDYLQCCGHWSPDGRFFVFLSRGGPNKDYSNLPATELWALDESRRFFRRGPIDPVQLTSGPIRWGTAVPSKDGTKLFANGIILRGELDRYDAQSSRFQPYLGGISAEFVTFSSDGKSVAYVTFPEGILWSANRDGSHPVQLTDASFYPLNAHWSPDGSQILFCNSDSNGLKAYVVSSQGGTPQPLLPNDSEGQSDPSWSADGRKIVFSTLVRIGNFNSVLRVLDLASHQITTLPGSEGMWSPRWSPNGRFIAGLYAGPTGGLKIFDFETQRWSMMKGTGRMGGYPTWSSDSQFIYVLRIWEDDPGVFRIRVADSAVERVADVTGFRHTGAFTHWMGLDPTDTPMLLRDVGTDDIYALTVEEK